MELKTGVIAVLFLLLSILLLIDREEAVDENASHGVWRGEITILTARGGMISTSSGKFWVSDGSLCVLALEGDSLLVLGHRRGMFISPFSIRLKQSESVISRVRKAYVERLYETIHDPAARGLTGGLLMGLRGMIPQSVVVAFRNSGTSHILSISGLHTGLVAGILLVIARTVLGKGIVSAWVAIAGIAVYVLLSGSMPATVRSGIMSSFTVMFLVYKGGKVHLLTVWWLALLLSLTYLPETLHDKGAQMSYGAVLSLILFGKNIKGKLSFILSPLYAGIAVTIGIAPLVSSVYGGFSLMGPPATVASIPFMLAVMFLGFVSSLGLYPASVVLEVVSDLWIIVLNLFCDSPREMNTNLLPVWGLLILCIRVFSKWNGFQKRFR
jgi:ComEC/Rec2-related protein